MKAESKQIQQGTAEWHQHRAMHFNASEPPPCWACPPTRPVPNCCEKATGITPEVDEATQARFDKGHEYEATARMLADEIIGSELYPMVFSGSMRTCRCPPAWTVSPCWKTSPGNTRA